ncbi:MAG: hypothetical protein CMM50_09480 [Rhodospirillaceae bacterium]|nr:hypothetical protein [Rhodospirillaceae bacterium]
MNEANQATKPRNPAEIGVREIMSREPEVVHVDSTVMEAAARMAQRHVGVLFVVDGDRLVGAITDRDIAVRSAAEGQDPKNTRVMHVMTSEVIHCDENATVADLAARMEKEQVRRVAILDSKKQLVGVVALRDVAATPFDGSIAERLLRLATAEGGPSHRSSTGGRAVASNFGEINVYSQRPHIQDD